MTSKELKKLNRTELLELLLSKTTEVEKLNSEIFKLQTELEEKNIKMRTTGSIAEASLKLNGVFEAAQKAADQYLESVISVDFTASEIEKAAKEKAEAIIKEAELKCENMEAETLKSCLRLLKEAEKDYFIKKCMEEYDPDDIGVIWN